MKKLEYQSPKMKTYVMKTSHMLCESNPYGEETGGGGIGGGI